LPFWRRVPDLLQERLLPVCAYPVGAGVTWAAALAHDGIPRRRPPSRGIAAGRGVIPVPPRRLRDQLAGVRSVDPADTPCARPSSRTGRRTPAASRPRCFARRPGPTGRQRGRYCRGRRAGSRVHKRAGRGELPAPPRPGPSSASRTTRGRCASRPDRSTNGFEVALASGRACMASPWLARMTGGVLRAEHCAQHDVLTGRSEGNKSVTIPAFGLPGIAGPKASSGRPTAPGIQPRAWMMLARKTSGGASWNG